ncbi:MAG: hypothetical protein A2Y12_04905 [Planctomycetes bacterium GWF2_42_9]|nr:MAG: hypothetical protein A2Y12_04905 [Planctomycetes bacterium GWF2_42_9]
MSSDNLVIEERWGTRKMSRGASAAFSIEYIIQRDQDHQADEITEVDALAGIYHYLDDNGLLKIQAYEGDLDERNYLPLAGYEVEQITYKIWSATVNYGWKSGKDDSTKLEVSFDTGGGTQKIMQTISPLQVVSYGDTPPDFQGAINVDDNSVNGVDIIVPVYNFTITRNMKPSEVDDNYKTKLFNLTGKVNNAPWYGYNDHEVLFMGASGSKHGRHGKWEMSYKFAASPNKTNITIGTITGIAKKGWQYLWVRYEKATSENALVKIPKNVYVHDVYESGTFSDLGWGLAI